MTHRPMSLLRNLPLHTLASGENKANGQSTRGGRERVPSASEGQVGPQISPHRVFGGGEGWQVREFMLTRMYRGPWGQASRPPPHPASPAQPRTYKYLSWESKG